MTKVRDPPVCTITASWFLTVDSGKIYATGSAILFFGGHEVGQIPTRPINSLSSESKPVSAQPCKLQSDCLSLKLQ